jgi:hypothetical protein|nr:MAG TPA: hypothetical protein [Caudoviricetes sp.]
MEKATKKIIKKIEQDMKEINMLVGFVNIMEKNEVGLKDFKELLKWFVMVYEVSDNDEELKDVFERTRKAKKLLETVNTIAQFTELEVE